MKEREREFSNSRTSYHPHLINGYDAKTCCNLQEVSMSENCFASPVNIKSSSHIGNKKDKHKRN